MSKTVKKVVYMRRLSIILFFIAWWTSGPAQIRDTLKLTITRMPKPATDTVYHYSSRIDTIALQPLKTDTSKIVKDVGKQDLEESKYRIDFRGRVRVNGYFDFQGMPSTEGFLPYDIPIREEKIDGLSSVYIGARQSRFGVEGKANTRVGTITTYLEFDFASVTNSFWRLRHAFAEWGYFKLGFPYSTFMDNASLPNTVEFEGPNSALIKRHGVIRYERKIQEKSIIGVSLEAPSSDYSNPADSLLVNKSKQSDFDVAARYKYYSSFGHVQIAGILRRIDYLRVDRMERLYGWGVLVSSAVRLHQQHQLYGQFSLGEGIANYYVGFSGRMLDAVYNPAQQDMELKLIQGAFLSYTYQWNVKWKFSLIGGISMMNNREFEADNSFRSSTYFAANAFFDPIETISLGIEITAGTRTNNDEQSGNAARASFCANFDF